MTAKIITLQTEPTDRQRIAAPKLTIETAQKIFIQSYRDSDNIEN